MRRLNLSLLFAVMILVPLISRAEDSFFDDSGEGGAGCQKGLGPEPFLAVSDFLDVGWILSSPFHIPF